jgi:hypothetical protein
VAEIKARQLDSPLDSFLRLTDATGQQLAANDDFEDKSIGLETHHADSQLDFTLPADGTYFIHLNDTQGQGGPEFAYRLLLGEPQPDFALRIVPSSLNLRAGMSVPVTVFALRRNGFTNAIELNLKNAPAGFSVSGGKISAGQDKAQFTLKGPTASMDKPTAITLEGRANIGGKMVTHTAVPAEDMMQAFFYRHLVPSKELAVMVSGKAKPFMQNIFKIISATPVRISPGGTALVKISAPPGSEFSERFTVKLDNAPEGISLKNITSTANGLELTFACDGEKMKAGAAGNLICSVLPKNLADADPKKKKQFTQRPTMSTLPAIPFECAAK